MTTMCDIEKQIEETVCSCYLGPLIVKNDKQKLCRFLGNQ